jgi:Protein kinase domain
MSVDRELLGRVLPAYEIGDELGHGGFGSVVSGQHRQLDRQVAIKQLPESLAADPALRRRFTAEARALASLDHPHVVPVFDFVERDRVCLLVMELLPGGTLRSRVATAGGFTAPHAVAVSLACASGLSAAHRRGILHRDVKPENMLFAASGVIKVTDFGLAKVVSGPGNSATRLTQAGDVLGTPAYIAPEQVRRDGELSPATDVYALATMLYELLAGALPFPEEGRDVTAILFQHAYEAPVPLGDAAPGVPGPVAAAVMRALATDPDQRFATAEAFGVALAGACTEAWGPGWLPAEVPIMDAGPIMSAAGQPSAPGRPAEPAAPPPPPAPGRLAAPPPAPVVVPRATGDSGEHEKTVLASPVSGSRETAAAGPVSGNGEIAAAGAASGGRETAASPETVGTVAGSAPSARRRRRIITAVIVVLIVIIAIVILVVMKPFSVYQS